MFLYSCISFDSYIKPQLAHYICCQRNVVYLLTPTSNHNFIRVIKFYLRLYIFWLLHQTTTHILKLMFLYSCISFDSYIKPQLTSFVRFSRICCISFDSYIKPQLRNSSPKNFAVVYLLTPTSNHNRSTVDKWNLSVEEHINP